MPGLRDLQRQFAAAVLGRHAPGAPGIEIGPPDERLARRLAVYRVNARENFAAALQAAYPVVHLELGDARFRSVAWSYQSDHPSTSGNLFEVGRHLPEFLAGSLQDHPDAYLCDLARLEWAVQEAMVASDSDARFDPRALATIPDSEHDSLRFRLHPAVRILQVSYPVFELWRMFHALNPAHRRAFGPQQPAAQSILVRRAGPGIELHQLDAIEYCCLACLLDGGTLGEMTAAALAVTDTPDLGGMLRRWAVGGVINDVTAGPATQP